MKRIIIFLLLVSNLVFAQTTPVIPAKTNNLINDFANILTNEQEEDLRTLSRSIQSESSAQIVLVTTDDLDKDYPIEQFSIDLAQSWGIGQRDSDNGMLILICPKNHKARMEVGYGLEGVLTDAYTRQLQADYFKPNFRNNDFHKGIREAMVEIKKAISPEAQEQLRMLEQQRQRESEEATAAFLNFLLWFVIIAVAAGLIGYLIYRAVEEKRKIAEEKRQKEERERREKERVKNTAENHQHSLNTLAKNSIKSLTEMGNFHNAALVLTKVKDIHINVTKALEDATYQEYESLCRPAAIEIDALSKSLINNFNIKKTVEANHNALLLGYQNVIHQTSIAAKAIERIKKIYDADVLNRNLNSFIANTSNIDKDFDDLINLSRTAVAALETGNFATAERDSKNIMLSFNHYQTLNQEVFNKEKEIQNAIADLQAYNKGSNNITQTVSEVVDYFKKHSSQLSSSLKTSWNTFSSQNSNFKVNPFATNPITELARVNTFLESLRTYLKKAKAEIQAIADAIAKKKREEEEEERRRLKKIRDAAIVTASYESSRRSSDDDNNRSSNSDSFGGGSFGGGGSSSDW